MTTQHFVRKVRDVARELEQKNGRRLLAVDFEPDGERLRVTFREWPR